MRGGLFAGGGERMRLENFFVDPFFLEIFLHRHLSCRVGHCRRRRHGLIWEGYFAKGESNMGAVLLEALSPGAFGSGCAVPCEVSKRSKCVETIPHVEKFSMYHILYG